MAIDSRSYCCKPLLNSVKLFIQESIGATGDHKRDIWMNTTHTHTHFVLFEAVSKQHLYHVFYVWLDYRCSRDDCNGTSTVVYNSTVNFIRIICWWHLFFLTGKPRSTNGCKKTPLAYTIQIPNTKTNKNVKLPILSESIVRLFYSTKQLSIH